MKTKNLLFIATFALFAPFSAFGLGASKPIIAPTACMNTLARAFNWTTATEHVRQEFSRLDGCRFTLNFTPSLHQKRLVWIDITSIRGKEASFSFSEAPDSAEKTIRDCEWIDNQLSVNMTAKETTGAMKTFVYTLNATIIDGKPVKISLKTETTTPSTSFINPDEVKVRVDHQTCEL